MQKKTFRADAPFFSFLLIIGVVFLIYSNTFSSPFHFDDDLHIVDNYQLRDLANFASVSETRYIGDLSFALNYHLGKLNVFGYHLVNITIHMINGFLVWWLVILTLKTPVMAETGGLERHKGLMALSAALLFVSHPIQTQAVTYLVQRYTSLATLFYLLSLVMYIQARLLRQDRGSAEPFTRSASTLIRTGLPKGGSVRWILCYLVALLSAVLAMKTKEISFTLPLILVLYEFTFMGNSEGTYRSWDFRRFVWVVPFLGTLLIIPLHFLKADGSSGDMVGALGETARETEGISRGEYLLTQFRVLVTYLRLLFLPVDQNVDYDYPISRSFDMSVFFSLLFLLIIVGVAAYLFTLSRRPKQIGLRWVAFGIFWFFITLSVESSVIPIQDVINEHRLYLPSVGVVLAFVSGLFYLFESAQPKGSLFQSACVLLLVMVIPLGMATYNRNGVWKEKATLWEDVVRKSPNKGRGYAELGAVYATQGRLKDAYTNFVSALKLAPNYVPTHLNLGTFYLKSGRFEEAEGAYMTALKLAPAHPNVHYNLGVLYHQQGRLEEAAAAYRTAVKLYPYDIKVHVNLGALYATQGRFEEATREFMAALKLSPDDPRVHYNLGKVRRNQGMEEEAKRHFETALKLKPDYAEALRALQ